MRYLAPCGRFWGGLSAMAWWVFSLIPLFALADPAGRRPLDLALLPTLTVGATTYKQVHLRSRDSRSVFFQHESGLGSARLADLPAELQTKLGYDPLTAPPDVPPPVRVAAPKTPKTTEPVIPERMASAFGRMRRMDAALGTPASFTTRQSMKDDFLRLNLSIKNQGLTSSCSAYAIVGAMEYQYFQLHGQAVDFSEDYVVQMVHLMRSFESRSRSSSNGQEAAPTGDAGSDLPEFSGDIGYTLPEVVGAIAICGIALEDELPPPARSGGWRPLNRALVEKFRLRRAVFFRRLPGANSTALLNNVVHALNAGFPVPAGLIWPPSASVLNGTLDEQSLRGGGGHAVTLVGYESPGCRPEDTVFIFKNSYGPGWGEGGYGRATWRFLQRSLLEGYVLEVGVLKQRF